MGWKQVSPARWVLTAAAASLFVFIVSAAMGSGPPSIEEMARSSDYVIVGKVHENHTVWIDGRIVTNSEVRIDPRRPDWKLKGDPEDTVIVSCLGGTLGNINQHASHEATLQEKEVAVLFLVEPTASQSAYFKGMRIISEWGKIPLLRPGEPISRLDNNFRLSQFLRDIISRVRGGGTP